MQDKVIKDTKNSKNNGLINTYYMPSSLPLLTLSHLSSHQIHKVVLYLSSNKLRYRKTE